MKLPDIALKLWVRDVPRNCVCEWYWDPPVREWVMWNAESNCPWHKTTQPLLPRALYARLDV